MKRRIFHLHLKSANEHKYYGSLAAVFLDNTNLGVSKYTLDRYDFTTPFENEICIIRKSQMLSTGDVKEAKA